MRMRLTAQSVAALSLPAGKSEEIAWDTEPIGGGMTMRRRRPASALNIASWRAASPEERQNFVGGILVREWLAAISNEQRLEIENRIFGLRAAQAKPVTAVFVH